MNGLFKKQLFIHFNHRKNYKILIVEKYGFKKVILFKGIFYNKNLFLITYMDTEIHQVNCNRNLI